MTTQPDLLPIAIDFETYYDGRYSLKKMSVVDYVMDPRFEVVGFAYALIPSSAQHFGPVKTRWVSGDRASIEAELKKLELHRRVVVAHNAMFEGAILEWQFGQRPGGYFCTMMAARPVVVPFTGSASLAKVSEHFDLPEKGDTISKVSGMRRADFTPAGLVEYGDYCQRDVKICLQAYRRINEQLPPDEAEMISLTMEKFLRGKLVLDREMLLEAQTEQENEEAKASLVLASLGLERMDVTSNPRFASALSLLGVTPPMKTSVTTGNKTFAFAKKDPDFLALRDHPDVRVQSLIEARLLLKSSIERSRLAQFIRLADARPTLPVPLLYYGAHTGRFSGMMGLNLQNLPRNSALRRSIRAPTGHKVVTVDLAAIEARITAELAGQFDLVDLFRKGADVYSEFASDIFGYPVSDCEETKDERFLGKMSILGLGFGMGATKFDTTLQGAGLDLGLEECERIVKLYRRRFPRIPLLWKQMDGAISKMIELPASAWWGVGGTDPHIPTLKFSKGGVLLPNGMRIYYPGLGRDGLNQASYRFYETPNKVYQKLVWGGALTENVVQALARIVLSRAELRLARAGLKAVLQVHDELVFVVPDRAVQKVKDVVRRVVTDPVPWMPGLPLACKIGVGDTYGEAK